MEDQTQELLEKIQMLEEENAKLKEELPKDREEDKIAEQFLNDFPEAEQFIDDICSLIQEKGIDSSDALNKAYALYLSQKYKAPEKLASDNDFLEKFIFTNDVVRQHFLKEYLESIVKAPNACVGGTGIHVPQAKTPKDISAAGKMARAFFRK